MWDNVRDCTKPIKIILEKSDLRVSASKKPPYSVQTLNFFSQKSGNSLMRHPIIHLHILLLLWQSGRKVIRSCSNEATDWQSKVENVCCCCFKCSIKFHINSGSLYFLSKTKWNKIPWNPKLKKLPNLTKLFLSAKIVSKC